MNEIDEDQSIEMANNMFYGHNQPNDNDDRMIRN